MPDTRLLSNSVIAPQKFSTFRFESNQLVTNPCSASARRKASVSSISTTPQAVGL
jgi:hypothetical protein